MTSSSSFGASVITLQFDAGREHRRRRAGSAGGHQRGADVPARRPADAADLQQGESGRRSHPDAGADLRQHAAAEGRGPGRHDVRAEDFAAARRRPGHHQRRPEAGRAHAGQSDGAGFLRHEPGAIAHRDRASQRRPGQGPASGRPRRPTPSAPTINCFNRRAVRRHHHRLHNGTPVRALRCRHGHRRAGKRQPGGLDEHHARRSSSTSSGSRAPTSSRLSTASSCCCRSLQANLPAVGEDHGAHRPHQHHPRQRERRAVRADADHRPGGDGDLRLPAHPGGHRSSPASRCRCRWSAPSA